MGQFLAPLLIAQAEVELLAGGEEHGPGERPFLVRMVQVGHEVLERGLFRLAGHAIHVGLVERHDREAPLVAPPGLRPDADPRKERRQLMELLPLPMIGRMVVALGTLDLNTQQNPRHLGRGVRRIGRLGHDIAVAAVVPHVAGGRDGLSGNR